MRQPGEKPSLKNCEYAGTVSGRVQSVVIRSYVQDLMNSTYTHPRTGIQVAATDSLGDADDPNGLVVVVDYYRRCCKLNVRQQRTVGYSSDHRQPSRGGIACDANGLDQQWNRAGVDAAGQQHGPTARDVDGGGHDQVVYSIVQVDRRYTKYSYPARRYGYIDSGYRG